MTRGWYNGELQIVCTGPTGKCIWRFDGLSFFKMVITTFLVGRQFWSSLVRLCTRCVHSKIWGTNVLCVVWFEVQFFEVQFSKVHGEFTYMFKL